MKKSNNQELQNRIIGLLISKEKYRFVDKDLIANVIREVFRLVKIPCSD